MPQNKHPNDLVRYRQRFRLSQRQVATLLGHKDAAQLSKFETGSSLPSLLTALRLAIIYRAPVDFLFADIYRSERELIRQRESSLAPQGQGVLHF